MFNADDTKISGLSFCPLLKEIVATGRTVDRNGKATDALGLSTVNNLLVLRNLHLSLRPLATLEIGMAYGASTLVFTQSHRDLGAVPMAQHTAIDPFQNDFGSSGLAAVEKAGLSGFLSHIEEFSDRALPRLLDQGQSFELIYIDGSHLFEDVIIDSIYSAQLLARGGIVAFDDSNDPHVSKVIRFIRSNMGHILTEVDIAKYRADRGQSIRYKIGRLVGRIQLTAFRKTGESRRKWDAKLRAF